jgi:hypothetical protein
MRIEGVSGLAGKAVEVWTRSHGDQMTPKTAFIVWRCEVNTWWITVLQLLGTIAIATAAARGSVAFAAWRKSFRDRLIGTEP